MRKYILQHTQMTNTFNTKIILHNYTAAVKCLAVLEFYTFTRESVISSRKYWVFMRWARLRIYLNQYSIFELCFELKLNS